MYLAFQSGSLSRFNYTISSNTIDSDTNITYKKEEIMTNQDDYMDDDEKFSPLQYIQSIKCLLFI